MNIYAGIYTINLFGELKKMINIYNNTKNLKSNFVFYGSDLCGKIQKLTEMIFKLMIQSENLSLEELSGKLIERKINPLLGLEILRTFMKLYEFKQLRECGIHYYLNQNLFYSDLLFVDKNKFEKQICESTNENNQNCNKNSNLNKNDIESTKSTCESSNSLELSICNVKSNKTFMNNLSDKKSHRLNLHPKILKEIEKIKNDANQENSNKVKKLYLGDNEELVKRKHSKISFISFMINLLSNNSHIQELVYLLKPLLHLVFIKIFGKNSMTTFLFTLILDYLSLRKKSSLYIDRYNQEKIETFTQKYLFNKEYQSRLMTILLSLLIRYPILDYITKPLLSKILFFLPESIRNFLLNDVLENINLHYIISN